MKDKRLLSIDYIFLTIAGISLILLVYFGLLSKVAAPFDLSLIPIVLIASYAGLNGVKLLINEQYSLGVNLIIFSSIVIALTAISRLLM